MNPVLRDFWITPSRIKCLYGGRSSSKSWDAAANAIRIARTCRVRFLATRMFQNKIQESVYSLLKIQIDRFGLRDEFEILNNTIRHKITGSEFLFYGLARNIDEIKSLESIDICWLEEAHAVTEAMWDILEPTIRKEGSEFWVIFNPQYATDFVYQNFVVKPSVDTLSRKINYIDNPFLSSTMLNTIEKAKEKDPEKFKHIYLGEPKTDEDMVFIKYSWVEAAIGFDLPDDGQKIIGYDVADEGEDDNATVIAKGSRVIDCVTWSYGDVIESTKRVYQMAIEQSANVTYDSIGVGAGVKGKMKELNPSFEVVGFNAGGKVVNPDKEYEPDKLNKDHFANVKAQAWQMLADRFYNTYRASVYGDQFPVDEMISIDPLLPNLEQLKFELCAPRKDYDGNMRLKVESKKDMKKRGIKSPNIADALIMCFAPREVEPQQLGLMIPKRLRR